MPLDHKRINAPEDAVPYRLFTKLNTKTPNELYQQLTGVNGLRKDGRKFSEHRKIYLKMGVVTHAKGSAYIEQGETKLVVSVFDPREIPNRTDYSLKGEIYCEFKFAPFSCPKRRIHQQDSQEKEYSAIMVKALESAVCLHEFPNFQVDVYVMVLHNDGSALSAAITASCAALSSAGIPMFDLIASSTLLIQGGDHIVDPNLNEESFVEIPISKEHGIVVMSILDTHEQVTQFYQSGNLSLDVVTKSIDHLKEVCSQIFPLLKKCLVEHVLEEVEKDQ